MGHNILHMGRILHGIFFEVSSFGNLSNATLFKAQDLLAWNWLKTCNEPHAV